MISKKESVFLFGFWCLNSITSSLLSDMLLNIFFYFLFVYNDFLFL